jgi:hypothetical protein
LEVEEEKRLGQNGIKKNPVGYAHLTGKCEYNCARVRLLGIKVVKLNGDLVWEWDSNK